MNRPCPLSLAAALALTLGARGAHATPVAERAFVDQTLAVPASVVNFLGTIFPESSAVGTSYLSPTFDPNLLVTEAATVKVTFLWEGAGYKNTFGYFTYSIDGGSIQILDRQLVFPNASFADSSKGWGGGQLATGDTVTLRDGSGNVRVFPAGSRIGFFLVSNGWSATLPWWNAASPAVPSTNPATNASTGIGVYTTLDELNPEVSTGRSDIARHAAMIRVAGTAGFLNGSDYLVIGMEDQRRTSSDQDFNDVMFLVQSTPEASILQTPLPKVDPNNNDPDGDGCAGLQDYFPEDPLRCTTTRTPATGYDSVVFEDLYPAIGDKDYNDAVVQTTIEIVKNAANQVKEIVGTYHLVARGARLDHSFGVVIDGVPAGTAGTLSIERFASDEAQSGEGPLPLGGFLKPDRDGLPTLRIDDLFPSTLAALPSTQAYANTLASAPTIPPASARFRVVFDVPLAPLTIAPPPFDPFLIVKRDQDLRDVHLVGKRGLPGRSTGLPPETGAQSFLDPDGYPWALAVPSNFRYPLEKVPIDSETPGDGAYPDFLAWRTSAGAQKPGWYSAPKLSGNRVAAPMSDGARSRPWTVAAGQ